MTSMGDFGARLVVAGQTQFRLWAPEADAVSVVVAQGQPQPLQRDEHGVFSATLPAGAGAVYRYVLADGTSVPDPASRAQAGDVHDDSVVVDPSYDWKHPGWRGRPWEEAVIYELHVGALGGYTGVKAELRRLAQLGITAIELMPLAEFPGKHNWGYDGVMHYAPDSAYGTPEELRDLVDTAHGLGLMVFLDVVYNHFGPAGNYVHHYAQSFFREDIHTPWGAAIDFRRPQVRRFFIENALYWLTDFRFDGLRFDAVSKIGDSGFLLEMAAEIKHTLAGRQVHLILENEHNQAHLLKRMPDEPKYDGQWNDDWHHCLHVLLTGETEGYYEDYTDPAAQLARATAEGFVYQGNMSKHVGAVRGEPSGELLSTDFIIFLQNHDQIGNRAMGDRLTLLAKPAALRAATLLLLLTPQIPMIFMGDEWAETNPFLFFTDHEPELAKSVREGRRKEFSHFAAFSDPEIREKIPDPNAHETFTASVPRAPAQPSGDQKKMLDLYEQALRVRAADITPRLRGARSAGAQALGDAGIRAAWTMADGAQLTIAVNFGAATLRCEPGVGDVLLSASDTKFSGTALPPFSAFAWMHLP